MKTRNFADFYAELQLYVFVDGLADIYGDDGIRLISCMKQTIWSFLERGDEDMTFAIRFVDELIENFNN